MKLHILGQEQDKLGGGWTWIRNMSKCFDLVSAEECDAYIVTSVSMIPKLADIPFNKKVILRVDNYLAKSRNRDVWGLDGEKLGRMEAMKYLAGKVDLVVYQSSWAESFLDPYLKAKNKTIILNSGDENIFKPEGETIPAKNNVYLYTRSSNHDNKQWHKAYYTYIDLHRGDPNSELWLAGRFSSENVPNNFDFFENEKIKYWGFVDDPETLATLYRSASSFIYSYYNDACSNTLIECILTGCEPMMLEMSGGAKDIMEKWQEHGTKYFYLDRMKKEYEEAINGI